MANVRTKKKAAMGKLQQGKELLKLLHSVVKIYLWFTCFILLKESRKTPIAIML